MFRFHFAVPPGYQHLMVEVYFNNEYFGELNTEAGQLNFVQYGRESGEPWTVPADDLLAAMEHARKELVRRSIFFGD